MIHGENMEKPDLSQGTPMTLSRREERSSVSFTDLRPRNMGSQRGLNPQIMGTMNAFTKGVRNRGSKRVPAPCRFVMPVPDCLGAVGSQFPPTFSFPLRQPNQYGDKPRMDGRERCFFNGPDEFAHASANHLEDLESNLGMNQAGGIEVLFTDEVDSGLVSRCGGCRISTAVKHWSLATELPGPLNRQHLLTAIRRKS
jgi:hypothetical protein